MVVKMRAGSPTAFTLVELIVVITILAVLATVGFLALQGYTKDAKDTAVKTNLKTAVDAVSLESATDGSSPRKYVIHDGARSISGTVLLGTALSPGAFWTAGTNYSAGTPDYAKLKLNGTNMVDANGAPFLFGAADLSEKLATGRTRIRSFFQIAADLGDSEVSVDGTYPTGDATSSGGLIASSSGSSTPLVASSAGSAPSASGGGGGGGGPAPTRYPGCDTDNIVLANGQHWAACNAGASIAYANEVLNDCSADDSVDCDAALRNVVGGLYQWGRNDNVSSAAGNTIVQAPAGTLAGGVGHSNMIVNGSNSNWLDTENGSLWGATVSMADEYVGLGSPAAMQGPCSAGYHVPTMKEWCDASTAIAPGIACGSVNADPSMVAAITTTLRLPAANRRGGDGRYTSPSVGNSAFYWGSNPKSNTTYASAFSFLSYGDHSSDSIRPNWDHRRILALSVRCLRNP